MDPYQYLANAIIERACDDYRMFGSVPPEKSAGKRAIVHFFRTRLFSVLTDVDPDWLIERLEEDCKHHWRPVMNRIRDRYRK